MKYRVTYTIDGVVRDVPVEADDETTAIFRAGAVALGSTYSAGRAEFVSVANESTGSWWTT